MSTITPAQYTAALKAEGVNFAPYKSDWYRHNRNQIKAPDFHGVMNHHTGPYSTISGMVNMCYVGRSDLVGPLCEAVADPTGKIWLVGFGRTNNAGLGDKRVLAAVVAERLDLLPAHSTLLDQVDGNSAFHAIEIINNGTTQPYSNAQIEAVVKWNAALHRAHGWKHSSIRHLDWTKRKSDPNWHILIDVLVTQCLALPAGKWKLVTATVPTPAPASVPKPPVVYTPQDYNNWRVESVFNDKEIVSGGPEVGKPVPVIKLLHEIRDLLKQQQA